MKGKKVFSSIVLILTLLISIYFVVFGVFALLGEMGMNINSEALAKLYESYVGTLMLFAIFCVAKLNIPSNSEFMGYVINYLMPILYLVTFIFALILLIKVLRNRACKKTAIFTLVISILTFVVGAFYFLGAFIYASGLASADIGKIITSQYAILVALVFAILCMFSGIILINYEGNGEAKVQANINGAQVQQNPEGERSFVNSFENQNNMNAQNGAQPNAQNDQVTGAVMWQAMNNGQTPATPANPTTTPNQPANPWGAQPTENAWGTSPTSTTFETTGANGSPASSPSFSADVQPSSYSPSFTQSTQPAPDQTQSTFAQPDASFGTQATPSSFGAQPETGSDTQGSTFSTPASGSTFGASSFPSGDAPAETPTYSSTFGADAPASSTSSEYLSANEVVDANGNPAGTNQDNGSNDGTQF